MNEDIRNFLDNDAEDLMAITGTSAGYGSFEVLVFSFVNGHLVLTCVDETDEITVSLTSTPPVSGSVDHPLLTDLVGRRISYAWEMTNHSGHIDAFQMRLVAKDRPDVTRQFEVAASTMNVYRVDGV